MKKAKLMLATLAIVAVVGTTLAFTAKEEFTYYTNNPQDSQKCNKSFTSTVTTTDLTTSPAFTIRAATTALTTTTCPDIWVVTSL